MSFWRNLLIHHTHWSRSKNSLKFKYQKSFVLNTTILIKITIPFRLIIVWSQYPQCRERFEKSCEWLNPRNNNSSQTISQTIFYQWQQNINVSIKMWLADKSVVNKIIKWQFNCKHSNERNIENSYICSDLNWIDGIWKAFSNSIKNVYFNQVSTYPYTYVSTFTGTWATQFELTDFSVAIMNRKITILCIKVLDQYQIRPLGKNAFCLSMAAQVQILIYFPP